MSKVIALYLPQFHPVPEMMNGMGRDLLSGLTLQKQNRCLKIISSLEFLLTLVSMI